MSFSFSYLVCVEKNFSQTFSLKIPLSSYI